MLTPKLRNSRQYKKRRKEIETQGVSFLWRSVPGGPGGENAVLSEGVKKLQLHSYDMLRIGQLMLQKGKWKTSLPATAG
ncbi:hypothetical protein DLD77_09920 [Chitinophaga alhagiae]|uniref:Uncharacterized protein n=1 Tax=Chitinophaga alhagiae TaxID=2203219 RepID=A0ABM6WDD9_9BACT|nr:hypothetical protein DLD77_09920 [Chitinophaga alhagiae]